MRNVLSISLAILLIFVIHSCKREKNLPFFVKKVEFPKNWNDQVIRVPVKEKIAIIDSQLFQSRILHRKVNPQNKVKGGTKILFDGPSKKEKIEAAILLSKSNGYDLYRIDLSSIASKYIGETEKNLARLFDEAEYKNWILFFDEADALFGKRTKIKDAHDRFTNLEISYLLQRIEEFDGIVIIATNNKNDIDSCHIRKFEFIINFTDQ